MCTGRRPTTRPTSGSSPTSRRSPSRAAGPAGLRRSRAAEPAGLRRSRAAEPAGWTCRSSKPADLLDRSSVTVYVLIRVFRPELAACCVRNKLNVHYGGARALRCASITCRRLRFTDRAHRLVHNHIEPGADVETRRPPAFVGRPALRAVSCRGEACRGAPSWGGGRRAWHSGTP